MKRGRAILGDTVEINETHNILNNLPYNPDVVRLDVKGSTINRGKMFICDNLYVSGNLIVTGNIICAKLIQLDNVASLVPENIRTIFNSP